MACFFTRMVQAIKVNGCLASLMDMVDSFTQTEMLMRVSLKTVRQMDMESLYKIEATFKESFWMTFKMESEKSIGKMALDIWDSIFRALNMAKENLTGTKRNTMKVIFIWTRFKAMGSTIGLMERNMKATGWISKYMERERFTSKMERLFPYKVTMEC